MYLEGERRGKISPLPVGVMAPTRTLEMLWIQQISIAGSSPGASFYNACILEIWAQGPLGASFHNAWKCRVILCALPHGAFINTCIHCHWKLHRRRCRGQRSLQEGRKTLQGRFLFPHLSFLPPLFPPPPHLFFILPLLLWLSSLFTYLMQEWKRRICQRTQESVECVLVGTS